MEMNLIKVVAGLIALVVGGEWLLRAAVGTSNRFAIPKFIIGMTVVSFATSLPELIVSIRSAFTGYPDLALGNVVGSNIANLGLVLGVVLLFTRIQVDKNGKVIDALPGVKGTTNSAPCLLKPAKEAALRTQWNADPVAPSKQVGTIIYTFSLIK